MNVDNDLDFTETQIVEYQTKVKSLEDTLNS